MGTVCHGGSRSVTVQNRINLLDRTPNGVVRVGDRPHTVENGPATVENGKNIIKKISKQGGDDRHSSNTFCTVDTTHPLNQFRTATLTNPPKPKGSQRGLPNRHSEPYSPTVAHSEAKVLTARPRHIYHMPHSDNPYKITSQPILEGREPSKSVYTLRVVALWFIFTVLLFV